MFSALHTAHICLHRQNFHGLADYYPNQTADSIALTVICVCTTLSNTSDFHNLFKNYVTIANYQSYVKIHVTHCQ